MPANETLPPFQALVDEHSRAVGAFLRGMLGPDDAEDALQETYLAALRAYRGFDGANPRAWLFTIARHKAIDRARVAARQPVALAEPDLVAATEPEGDSTNGEVWSAVADLPPKQREAVLLRFAADLRYREIGLAMECSEAAARRNVHEAITKLRQSSEVKREVRI